MITYDFLLATRRDIVMKKLAGIVIIVLLGILGVGCMFPVHSRAEIPPVRADEKLLADLPDEESKAVRFLQGPLQTPEGILFYLADLKSKASYSVSESMGQAMEYAALEGDRALFDYYAQVTQAYFKAPSGYYYWKIDIESKRGETTSALVDDLRIARAYLAANERFGGVYQQELQAMSDIMLKTDIDKNGNPCDFYDGAANAPADTVSLFYLDVETMDRLCALDKRWAKTTAVAHRILRQMPENDYGFYSPTYSYAKQRYVETDSINMVENLYTAIDAFNAGKNTRLFEKFLQQQVRKGKIYNHYNMDGSPADEDESTAVYALAARFLTLCQDKKAAAWCRDRTLAFQIGDDGTFAGGFGDQDTGLVYAFDQLEALLMLRTVDMGL